MHGQSVHASQPQQTPQSGLGAAVGLATNMSLLLMLRPQDYLQYYSCPGCGSRQAPGGKFCSQCGIRLVCPTCGAASWGKNFCHNCGQTLKR